jgi:cytochrome P450
MDIVTERRKEMENHEFNKLLQDFLTILLTDELFAGNDEMVIDECVTFMLAATQTTTTLLKNLFFFLTMHPQFAEKARVEFK